MEVFLLAEIKTNHMATVKVKVRASTIPTKEGTVFYQVIHNLSLIHISNSP